MRCSQCGGRAKGRVCAHCRKGKRTTTYTPPSAAVVDPGNAFASIPAAADPQTMTLHALVALEDALTAQAAVVGVSDELEKRFERYQKLKSLALRAGTESEARTAMRMTLIEVVKLVF